MRMSEFIIAMMIILQHGGQQVAADGKAYFHWGNYKRLETAPILGLPPYQPSYNFISHR